jgi:hypothetical protein
VTNESEVVDEVGGDSGIVSLNKDMEKMRVQELVALEESGSPLVRKVVVGNLVGMDLMVDGCKGEDPFGGHDDGTFEKLVA